MSPALGDKMEYDEETLRQLRNADWESISLRLLKFAISVGGKSVIAQGMDTQDVVKDIIAKTFSGERKWNPEIALYVHLKEAVRSTLSNKGLYSSRDRFGHIPTEKIEMEVRDQKAVDSLTDELVNMKKLIANNIELLNVFEAILNGAQNPREIATITGLHPQRVSEYKRMLKRYWLKINGGIK